MKIKISISPGELLDKITILEIKLENTKDDTKAKNIMKELTELYMEYVKKIKTNEELLDLSYKLKKVNKKLWIIEDKIRKCDKNKDFGYTFIELAKSIYRNNDERYNIKYKINKLLNSALFEEKIYDKY